MVLPILQPSLHQICFYNILVWQNDPLVRTKKTSIEIHITVLKTNIYCTFWPGCVSRKKMIRRARLGRALLSASISVSDSAENSIYPIKLSGRHRTSCCSTENRPGLFICPGIHLTVFFASVWSICNAEKERLEKEREDLSTISMNTKNLCRKQSKISLETTYNNSAHFHRSMLAAVWEPFDGREQEHYSENRRASEQVQPSTRGTPPVRHEKSPTSVPIHLLRLTFQVDNDVPSWVQWKLIELQLLSDYNARLKTGRA